MKKIYPFLVLVLAFLVSCKNNSSEVVTSKSETAPKNKYTLTAFNPSAAYPDAKINGYTYIDGTFSFDVLGDDYKLGEQTPDAAQKMCANSGKGQHIHLIINDLPYAAKYVSEFDHEVEDGDHHLLAFLSRSYHESIKTPGASVMQKISVSSGSITDSKDIVEPILFYSRPKGTYVGKDAEKVMLDFFIGNTTLEENKVVANINGEMHTIDTWQPYYITGLPMGENKITLSLVDKENRIISAPNNPVTRVFTLKEDPLEKQQG